MSDLRMTGAAAALVLAIAPLAALAQQGPTPPPAPQAPAGGSEVLASSVEMSRNAATLHLELTGGRTLDVALRNGNVVVNGDAVGRYSRGDDLDDSWRGLLNAAMETPNDAVGQLLVDWQPPSGSDTGRQLDSALESALKGTAAVVSAGSTGAVEPTVPAADAEKVQKLQSRIDELESLVNELEDRPASAAAGNHGVDWGSPFRHIWAGFSGVLSTIALYLVLLGMGFAAVFFGRHYLEGVADTARHHTLRSWGVGLAGSFLALPVFVLGIVGLAVSLVGIPLLLAWVPLFPVAVVVAGIFGYLAVAHAAGEALAERRLEGSDWFSRGNSYYYVMTGLGLLLAIFVAGHVVQMAGPWLGFIRGLLMFVGGALSWAALTIGFGAVLLSRAGTRPLARTVGLESEEIHGYEREPRV